MRITSDVRACSSQGFGSHSPHPRRRTIPDHRSLSQMLATSVLLAVLAPGPVDGGEPKSPSHPGLFETLVTPACSHCVDESRRKAGELRDDDRVLAWVRGKYDGGAIPYRWFLVP